MRLFWLILLILELHIYFIYGAVLESNDDITKSKLEPPILDNKVPFKALTTNVTTSSTLIQRATEVSDSLITTASPVEEGTEEPTVVVTEGITNEPPTVAPSPTPGDSDEDDYDYESSEEESSEDTNTLEGAGLTNIQNLYQQITDILGQLFGVTGNGIIIRENVIAGECQKTKVRYDILSPLCALNTFSPNSDEIKKFIKHLRQHRRVIRKQIQHLRKVENVKKALAKF